MGLFCAPKPNLTGGPNSQVRLCECDPLFDTDFVPVIGLILALSSPWKDLPKVGINLF